MDGTNLSFTPGGGESPQVIPAADIRKRKMNAIAGKDVGAFHIATANGLYLNLAPESGNREDGRTMVETLRKQLAIAG